MSEECWPGFELRIPQSRRQFPGSGARAFTLIEVLLVAALMALMASMMAPRLSHTFQNVNQNATLGELAETFEAATAYAIRHRVQVRFRFDKTQGAFWLEQRQKAGLEGGFVRLNHGVLGEGRHLPENMSLTIEFSGQTGQDQSEKSIIFSPDGQRTPALIELTDRRKRSRKLRLGPTIGDYEILQQDTHA